MALSPLPNPGDPVEAPLPDDSALAPSVRPARARAAATYAVKELFLTLQGEGGQAGRAAVFCRFAGCNLWSGREQDRASAVCNFCDTDFVGLDGPGGGRFADPEALAAAAEALWKGEGAKL